eukprot:1272943-Heterocapsa_arctica.AAC.1
MLPSNPQERVRADPACSPRPPVRLCGRTPSFLTRCPRSSSWRMRLAEGSAVGVRARGAGARRGARDGLNMCRAQSELLSARLRMTARRNPARGMLPGVMVMLRSVKV